MKNQTRLLDALLDADQLDILISPASKFLRLSISIWFKCKPVRFWSNLHLNTLNTLAIIVKVSWSSRHLAYETFVWYTKTPLQRNTHYIPTMSYKTNYELYVSKTHALLKLINRTNFFFSLEEASTADGHPRQMSFSHRWQRSTRMSRPCSHSIIPATAPSPVTVTRDIGLRPTQHRLWMIPCPCVALVSLFLSVFFTSIAFSSNIA